MLNTNFIFQITSRTYAPLSRLNIFLFLTYFKNNPPGYIFADLTLLVAPVCVAWQKYAVAPHALAWQDCHVGMLRSARKGSASSYSTCQSCHATPTGVTVQPCHATPLAWQGLTLEKSYLFHTNSDGDDFYTKIVALNEIYNFIVLSFFI